MMKKQTKKLLYINYLTVLFTLVYGMKTLDGSCVTYLSEELMTALHCTTAQYSSLSSIYYLSYSISCMAVGILTSRVSRRKILIAPMTLITGIISLATSQVSTYAGLVLCRFFTGFFQGGSFSLMLAILSKNLVANDYGKRNGTINLGSSVISTLIGPVLFSYMALHHDWNTAYYITGPAIIVMSAIMFLTVGEVEIEIQQKTSEESPWQRTFHECIHSRVFMMCLCIGILETVSNLSIGVFAPLYYTDIMGYSTMTKAAFLSAKGLCNLPVMLVVPWLADRLPVRKVMIGTFILALTAPLATFLLPGSTFSAVILAVFGSAGGATVSLFTYMIPGMRCRNVFTGLPTGSFWVFLVLSAAHSRQQSLGCWWNPVGPYPGRWVSALVHTYCVSRCLCSYG